MDGTSLRWSALVLAAALTPWWGGIGAAANLDDPALSPEVLGDHLADLTAQIEERAGLVGYYDFEYLTDNKGDSPSHFRQHHVSLFVSRSWTSWRVFSEIEFENAPVYAGDGGTVGGNGELKVETAWAEYLHAEWLHVRGGKLLLPQYWNVNHYPNVVLSTERPLMVRALYPADTTGLMAYGTAYVGQLGTTYHLYYGNGQSADRSHTDDNEGKEVGGQLTFHLDQLVDGVARMNVGIGAMSDPTATDHNDVYGLDTQINAGRYELLAEYAKRASDASGEGFYVQPSARVWREVRCFYRYEFTDFENAPRQERHTLGVNFRPQPDVSRKLEVNTNDFSDATESYEEVAASVAIFF